MKKHISMLWLISAFALLMTALPLQADDKTDGSFVHAPIIKVDGKKYYLAGAPDGPNGATDIPGHVWVVTGKKKLVGKHFNTGPFGAPQWWSSTTEDGALLYAITAVIDKWSMAKSVAYYNKGFVHYHELVSVEDGSKHPNKVIWLRHTAVTHFDLDAGPHPELAHHVMPGVDFIFIPNWMMPYDPAS